MAISSVGGGSYADGNQVNSTTRNQSAPASSSITMDGFMLLMAKQMENQDMNNPTSNAEMMQQLTSMATVQSMNTFSELSSTQYALSLMGQEVKVAKAGETTGKMEMKTGTVVGVNLSNMKIYLEDDKASYGLGNIMEVGKVPEAEKEDDGTTGGTTDDTDDTDPDPNKNPVAGNNPDPETNPTPGTTKTNNSLRSTMVAASSDQVSRTDPTTGRTATRVSKDDDTDSKAAAATAASAYDSRVAGKTYTESRGLRMEYLPSDKREALARQHEIPEDKKIILAAAASGRRATGPGANSSSVNTASGKTVSGNTATGSNASGNKSSDNKSTGSNSSGTTTLDPRRI